MDELKRDLNQLPYHVTTEVNRPFPLSPDDIYDLGFLRSNPEKKIYQHKDKDYLYLLDRYGYSLGVRDMVDEWIEIWKHDGDVPIQLYNSNQPKKEDIQKIIDEN